MLIKCNASSVIICIFYDFNMEYDSNERLRRFIAMYNVPSNATLNKPF